MLPAFGMHAIIGTRRVLAGGLDWRFSTVAMWLANGACLATLAAAKQSWGPFAGPSAGGLTLGGVWAALAVFMWVQVAASVLRVASGTGRWRAIRRPTGRPTGATSVSDSSREASRVAKLRAEVARVGLAQVSRGSRRSFYERCRKHCYFWSDARCKIEPKMVHLSCP
jgi:hypothetical protein